MKMTKRIAALVVALLMLLTAVSAVAEPMTAAKFAAQPASITIANDNSNVTIVGSEFKVYKLFEAVYNETTKAITYAFNATSGCVAVTYNDQTGDDLIPVVAEMDKDEIRLFADAVYAAVSTPTASAKAETESVTIKVPNPGYYLVTVVVKNPNGAEGKDGVVSRAILVSAHGGNVTATLKVDAPSMDKQIQHNELANSTDEALDMVNGWGPVGDNQIGDTVHYRTITTVADTTGYEVYNYVIHDTMDAGLTFVDGSVQLFVGNDKNAKLDSKYFKVGQDGDHTFCVTVDILTAVADGVLAAGDKIYTYYDAILNEDALIYDEGHNDNVAYLEYSNDVYDTTGKKTGETPEVRVYDWTFKYGVSKVDADGNKLTGAKFVLSESGNLNVTYANGELSSTEGLIGFVSETDYTISDEPANYIIDAGEVVIKGLDDQTTYYLYEVQEPEGYSKLTQPVSFKITCEYTEIGNETAKDNPSATATGEITEIDMESCALATGIKNVSGSVLPSTGGMGTTLFYVVGGLMVMGAVAVLLLRRRTNK